MSADIAAITAETVELLESGRQVSPYSERPGGLSLAEAYKVAARVRSDREAKGDRAVGRKIGFTNKTIWDEYDVRAPIWNYVFESTVDNLRDGEAVDLAHFSEPRLEPEIMFGFAAAPSLDMDDLELLGTIEWAAHGFEIVQSLFPAWRFSAADTVAAYGLHGALRIGKRIALQDEATRRAFLDLRSLRIELRCNGELVDSGVGSNVLDGGPLAAVRHVIGLLEQTPDHPGIEAGEIVTTGTLTRAMPIEPGQTWSTRILDAPLSGETIRFR